MYNDLGLFQCFWFFGHHKVLEAIDEFNVLQYLTSTKGSSSALVGGRSCTCMFYCTSIEPFLVFLHFMVYSVETVTEAFLALLFFIIIIFLFFYFSPHVFCCFAENCDVYFFLNNLFYITIIINQCK